MCLEMLHIWDIIAWKEKARSIKRDNFLKPDHRCAVVSGLYLDY